MLSNFTNFFQNILVTPFTLKAIPGFPYMEWFAQRAKYQEYTEWYENLALNEKVTDPETNETVDKYPLKINPIQNTCEKHTAVLFGLSVDSLRLATMPVKFSPNVKDKAKRKTALELIEKVTEILEGNNIGTIFVENGIKSQYMGGSILAARFRATQDGGKIEITNPSADEFIGIPENGNYFRLREAWIIREISYTEAKSYIPDIREEELTFYYIEHWTKTEYEISINGHPVLDDLGEPFSGENVFGIVPIVYIPHIRAKGFLGKSIINETIKGLIKEMNLRWADLGDAVSNDSHSVLVGSDITNSIAPKSLPDGRPWIDIGQSSGMDGKSKPDFKAVKTDSASDPMIKFGDKLDTMYRREANHPAVADGLDEGSQRSSLTLNTRMWPLIAHVELERLNWTVGLLNFLDILITIMVVKKINGTRAEAKELRFNVEWPPMLPRDREQLVNELSVRASANLGSLRHLMSLLDDIQFPDEQLKEIIEEKKRLQETIQNNFAESKTSPSSPSATKNTLENRTEKSVKARTEEKGDEE